MKSTIRGWIWGFLVPLLVLGAGIFALGIYDLSKCDDAHFVGAVVERKTTVLTQNPDSERFRLKFSDRIHVWDRSPYDIDVEIGTTITRLEIIDSVEIAIHFQTWVNVRYSGARAPVASVQPALREAAMKAVGVPEEFATSGVRHQRVPTVHGSRAARNLGIGALIITTLLFVLPIVSLIAYRRSRRRSMPTESAAK